MHATEAGFCLAPHGLPLSWRRQNGQSLLSTISFSLSFAGNFPNDLQNHGGWVPDHPITPLNMHTRPLSPCRARRPSASVTWTAAAPDLPGLEASFLPPS